MPENKENALIFGSGLTYKLIIDIVLDKYNPIGIIDNNHRKHGTYLNGIMVLNPKSVTGMDFDVVIIAASQISEMVKQLVNYGVHLSKIKLGAELALNKHLNKSNYDIKLSLDNDFNIKIENSFNKYGLTCLDFLDDKKIFFRRRDVFTLLGLCDNNNRLPTYFKLASRYYKDGEGLFIDIGGNIGTSSLEAASFKKVTKCITFEPSSENFSLLKANVSINNLDNKIETYNYAISDTDGENKILLSNSCSGDNTIIQENIDVNNDLGKDFLENHSRNEVVKTVVLDDFLSERLDEVKFLWIDVQGYEYFVLSGCKSLMGLKHVALQIEYWPQGLRRNKSIKLLNELLIENYRYFIDMNEFDDNEFVIHDIVNINTLEEKLSNKNEPYTDIFLIKDI